MNTRLTSSRFYLTGWSVLTDLTESPAETATITIMELINNVSFIPINSTNGPAITSPRGPKKNEPNASYETTLDKDSFGI